MSSRPFAVVVAAAIVIANAVAVVAAVLVAIAVPVPAAVLLVSITACRGVALVAAVGAALPLVGLFAVDVRLVARGSPRGRCVIGAQPLRARGGGEGGRGATRRLRVVAVRDVSRAALGRRAIGEWPSGVVTSV